jgi:hypothetical protein
MAKRRKHRKGSGKKHRKGKRGRKKGRSKKSLGNRHVIAHHKVGSKDFACYTKRVRAGRSRKKTLRMYCPNVAAK